MKRIKKLDYIQGIKSFEWKYLFQRYSSTFLDKITGLISSVLLAKLTDSSIYGEIILAYAVTDIIISAYDFGLNTAVTVELSKSQNSLHFPNIILYKYILIPIVIAVAFIFSFINSNKPSILIILLIVTSEIINSISQAYHGILFSISRFDLSLKTILFSRSIQLFLYIISFFVFPNYMGIILIIIFQYLINLFITSYQVKKIGIIKPVNSFELIISLIKKYKYLGFMRVANSLHDKVDNLVISFFLPISQVAVYGVSYLFFRNVNIIGTSLGSVLLPKFSYTTTLNDSKVLKKMFNETVGISILIGFILQIFLWIFAPIFIELLWGNKYTESINIALILTISIPFLITSSTISYFLTAIDRNNKLLFANLLSFIVNIILNLSLVPFWGLFASAIITDFTVGINCFVLYIFVYQYFEQDKK